MTEDRINRMDRMRAGNGPRAICRTLGCWIGLRRVLRRFKGQLKGFGKVMTEAVFGIFKVGETRTAGWGVIPALN